MSVLTKPFSEEQMKYYLQVSSGFYSCFVLIFLNLLITACLLFLFSFFLMPVLFHKFVMDKLMQSLIASSVTLQWGSTDYVTAISLYKKSGCSQGYIQVAPCFIYNLDNNVCNGIYNSAWSMWESSIEYRIMSHILLWMLKLLCIRVNFIWAVNCTGNRESYLVLWSPFCMKNSHFSSPFSAVLKNILSNFCRHHCGKTFIHIKSLGQLPL